ncbi:MAG: LLM class flavin-dependent oxidoreductase [Gammaproteobacteria bacterium]|nr:LLM class flavin-dependent oxidoreductase [Gammaproteobacteria bacterium]
MAHPLRFQIVVLPRAPWPEMVATVQRLETLGADMVGLADHFIDWSNPPRPWLELWTHAAALAQATPSIRICTCVAQIPLRDPATMANQALTLDRISNGRLELGLGIGLPIDPSYEMMGLENWSNKERVDRFGEYVDLVEQLIELGISEFGLYYPSLDEQRPMLERLLGTVIPVLKRKYASGI